jgi:hypothetical protein
MLISGLFWHFHTEGNLEMLPKIGVNMPCGEIFFREKYNIYLTNFGQNATF